ncbi:MAG TPA: outer membrane beta-barrel protein, partial [Tepidisphaeraceae bacterium]|nr:outer membrane beta-barrel protein [Tepidisphaeraceae bacterium]
PTGGETGIWWAAAGYGTYKVNDYLTVQARAEYFSDHDGVRGIGTQLYELTGGVSIKPFPKDEYGSGLMLRPEIRYDFANEKVFDGGANDDQCTFGIDALYSF